MPRVDRWRWLGRGLLVGFVIAVLIHEAFDWAYPLVWPRCVLEPSSQIWPENLPI